MEMEEAGEEESTQALSSRQAMISVDGADPQAVDSVAVSEDSAALEADHSEEEEQAEAGSSHASVMNDTLS